VLLRLDQAFAWAKLMSMGISGSMLGAQAWIVCQLFMRHQGKDSVSERMKTMF